MLTKRSRYVVAVSVFMAIVTSGAQARGATDGPKPKVGVVWIYKDVPGRSDRDTRSATERLFAPFGYMPAERTSPISVNQSSPIDPPDPSKGTCMEFLFEFKDPLDWVGTYMLLDGGTAWGTKAGIDVQKLLDVEANTKLALRFRARGRGAVSFKIGGVTNGPHPSSLRLPRQVDGSPTTLTKEFREYTIGPIAARDLANLIDPFCVVTSGLDNRGSKSVVVQVDDLRIEAFEKQVEQTALPRDWHQRLTGTLWVCYTPTGFNPTIQRIKQPSADEIRADLAAIRQLGTAAGIPEGRLGIITYGCSNGLEQIPELAREAKLAVILGIFGPHDGAEIKNARKLLGQEELSKTIIACCVGNEAVTFRRATLDEIEQLADQLREVRHVPMTTTEIVQSYGEKRLFAFDFTLANVHAIFAGIHAPDRAATWAVERAQDLLASAPAGHPVLIKEFGWPAGPRPTFSEEQQVAYWRAIFGSSIARKVNVCIFDGLSNVPWKNEPIRLPEGKEANVGPYWPVLFEADRKPRPFAVELLKLWESSRSM